MNNSKKIVFEVMYSKLLLSESHYSYSVKIIRNINAGEKIILLKIMDYDWYKILDQYMNIGFINTLNSDIVFRGV